MSFPCPDYNDNFVANNECMEQLSEIFNLLGGAVTSIVLPLLGVLLFYDSKKRSEAAKAKLAEAEARKAEEANITSYAAEWKELYERKEQRVTQLEAKADDDRRRIRELQEKNLQLSLDLQAAKFLKCEVKGCKDRQPPTGY